MATEQRPVCVHCKFFHITWELPEGRGYDGADRLSAALGLEPDPTREIDGELHREDDLGAGDLPGPLVACLLHIAVRLPRGDSMSARQLAGSLGDLPSRGQQLGGRIDASGDLVGPRSPFSCHDIRILSYMTTKCYRLCRDRRCGRSPRS